MEYIDKFEGVTQDSHGLGSKLVDFLFPFVRDKWLHSEMSRYDMNNFENQLKKHWPNFELKADGTRDLTKVNLWVDGKALSRGRAGRTQMKVGKAFALIFPWLKDDQPKRDSLVDAFKAQFSESSYVEKFGKERGDFKRAYAHDYETQQNMATTSQQKQLGLSCMRDSFSHLDCHPAEIYASGDFTIFWLENQNEEIAARSVVMTLEGGEGVAGPIYASCEKAYEQLTKAIKKTLPDCDFHSEDYSGASVLVIEDSATGCKIGPYFDCKPNYFDDGGTLGRGSYELEYTSGLAEDECSCTCEDCGNRVHEDDLYYVDDATYCESCFIDLPYCDYCEETYVGDSPRPVHTEHGLQYWCESACDNYATYIDRKNHCYCNDIVYTDAHGDYITKDCLENGEWFVSDWDGEFYPSDEMENIDNGDMVGNSEIDKDKYTYVESESHWVLNEELDLKESE